MIEVAVLDDDRVWMKKIAEITKLYFFQKGTEYKIREYLEADLFLMDLEDGEYFHIYLLDVEMPGISGLDVGRKIRTQYAESFIVYITNYVEYAVEAFEANAFHFIPKTVLDEKLPDVFDKICPRILTRMDRYYYVETGIRLEAIPYQDIYYLKKDGKYVLIFHRLGCSRIRKSLHEVYEELDTEEFIFIDKSYVANILHIMSLKQKQMTMRNNEVLPVSRPRIGTVRDEIMEYWRRYR